MLALVAAHLRETYAGRVGNNGEGGQLARRSAPKYIRW